MSTVDQTIGASILPAGEWAVDAGQSSVTFAVRHMLVATVDGRFREFDGTLETGPGAPRARGAVKVASVDTNESVRDEHLRRSPDFFDVERYPAITFNSTRIDSPGAGRLHVVGELTMRGVTRQIELDGKFKGARSEADGEERIELSLHGELNRRDFGLTWNQALETGGALLGTRVKVALEISAVKRPAGRPAG